MKHIALIAALALAGCATPKAPEPIVRTVTIEVPIRVACKTAPVAQPEYAKDVVDLRANIFDLAKALLITIDQLLAENSELRGALAKCE